MRLSPRLLNILRGAGSVSLFVRPTPLASVSRQTFARATSERIPLEEAQKRLFRERAIGQGILFAILMGLNGLTLWLAIAGHDGLAIASALLMGGLWSAAQIAPRFLPDLP